MVLATRPRDAAPTFLYQRRQEGRVEVLVHRQMLLAHRLQKRRLQLRPASHTHITPSPWMRHVHREVRSQHVEPISRIPQIRHPLHLVIPIVQETLVERRQRRALAQNQIATLKAHSYAHGSCLSFTKQRTFTSGWVKLDCSQESK